MVAAWCCTDDSLEPTTQVALVDKTATKRYIRGRDASIEQGARAIDASVHQISVWRHAVTRRKRAHEVLLRQPDVPSKIIQTYRLGEPFFYLFAHPAQSCVGAWPQVRTALTVLLEQSDDEAQERFLNSEYVIACNRAGRRAHQFKGATARLNRISPVRRA